MTTTTPNKGYTYPANSSGVDTWDSNLNANFDLIDLNTGGTYLITIGSSISGVTFNSTYCLSYSSTTITLPTTLSQNLNYYVSGTSSSTATMVMATLGGLLVVTNRVTSGTLRVTGTVSGSYTVATDTNSTFMATTDGAIFRIAGYGIFSS